MGGHGSLTYLVDAGRQALMLAIGVSVPVVAAAALVSLLVALVQSLTQVHDATLGHLPRLIAVVAVLAALGPWMGHQIAAFALRVFGGV
jgi:flagellar biosynthetic protein FliQ